MLIIATTAIVTAYEHIKLTCVHLKFTQYYVYYILIKKH